MSWRSLFVHRVEVYRQMLIYCLLRHWTDERWTDHVLFRCCKTSDKQQSKREMDTWLVYLFRRRHLFHCYSGQKQLGTTVGELPSCSDWRRRKPVTSRHRDIGAYSFLSHQSSTERLPSGDFRPLCSKDVWTIIWKMRLNDTWVGTARWLSQVRIPLKTPIWPHLASEVLSHRNGRPSIRTGSGARTTASRAMEVTHASKLNKDARTSGNLLDGLNG